MVCGQDPSGYGALGLSPGASKDDITKAYKRCEQSYFDSGMDPAQKAEWTAARKAYYSLVGLKLMATDDSRQERARQPLRKPTPQPKEDSLRAPDQSGTPASTKPSKSPTNLSSPKKTSEMPLALDKPATRPAKSKSPTNLPRQKETSQPPLAPNKTARGPVNLSSSPSAPVGRSCPHLAISLLSEHNREETWESFQVSLVALEAIISKLGAASTPHSIFYWSQFCSGMLVLIGRIVILSAPVPPVQRSGTSLDNTHESVLSSKIHDLYLQTKLWHEEIFPGDRPIMPMAEWLCNNELGRAVKGRFVAIINSLDKIAGALEQHCSSHDTARVDTSRTYSCTFPRQVMDSHVVEATLAIDHAMRNLLDWSPMIKDYCCPSHEDKCFTTAISAVKRQVRQGDPLTLKEVAAAVVSESRSAARSAATAGSSSGVPGAGSSTTVDKDRGWLPSTSALKSQDPAGMVVFMKIFRATNLLFSAE